MKHLLFLLILFSASLTAFSQVADTTQPLRQFDANVWVNPDFKVKILDLAPERKPDTVRAICLVTMCRRCAAEPMPGYVVIEQGKRPVYLDCNKRALKLPQVGWDFREVDVNYKK